MGVYGILQSVLNKGIVDYGIKQSTSKQDDSLLLSPQPGWLHGVCPREPAFRGLRSRALEFKVLGLGFRSEGWAFRV